MTNLGDLAFHMQYHLREVPCVSLQHDECGAVHREHTGEATLTLAGPSDLVREAAALVFPDLARVFNPPKAQGRWPVGKALSAVELDSLPAGSTVTAGAFADGARAERVRWVKLNSDRWNSASTYGVSVDGQPGVSAEWLANNRRPALDTSSDDA